MVQISRTQIITLSNAAYQLNQFAESKKALITWLKTYPNDLWIRYRLAIILYKVGEYESAIRLCELITSEDPEFYEVWGLLAVLYPEGSTDRSMAEFRARSLQGKEEKKGFSLKKLFKKSAEEEDVTLENDEFDILTAVNNAKLLLNDEDRTSGSRILNIYYRRWPQTIQFKLILGHILNQVKRDDEGMAVIQSAVDADVTGQVGRRIWGDANPYKNLWVEPDQLSINVEGLKFAPEIVKLAGLENMEELIDRSTSAAPVAYEPVTESAESGDTETAYAEQDKPRAEETNSNAFDLDEEKIGIGFTEVGGKGLFGRNLLKKKEETVIPIGQYVYRLKSGEADDRKPVYVIMSSVTNLNRKYGSNNKDFINQEMNAVADAINNRKGWEAQVFYPDEYVAVGASGPTAEMIHKSLVKLDASLKEKDKMIGALLIVGGDDIVPFFSLKNPTGDNDTSVPSDAPYGALDSDNCYEMQWPVGRLPGDESKDSGLLLSQLRNIQNFHIMQYSKAKSADKPKKSAKKAVKRYGKCFGYTCAAWLTPSKIVYKTIADTNSLSVSPATTSSNFPLSSFDSCDFAYFNLHGIKGQPNWYGQKKSDDTSSGPNIPVALEISNVVNIKNTPKVVFAECCYGAETPKRTEQNCMSLHFIGKATRVFVGSTTIAYGALNSQLTAADLLGYLFWKHLLTGISCGEAFRRAKKNLATEMEQKNGGLDSEIQKTLLSFVYYGDPLYTVDDGADINDIMQRSKNVRAYELLSEEFNYDNSNASTMSGDIYKEVKDAYHIGAAASDFAQCIIKKQINRNLTGRYAAHSPEEHSNYVLTYVKDARVGSFLDRSVIRVTVRDDGVIQKVSFSR